MKRISKSGALRRLLLAVAMAFIPLALFGVYTLVSGEFRDVRELRGTAEQAIGDRDNLAELLTIHLDAETGVRGFALTGNPAFLQPYRGASDRREAVFRRLADSKDETVRSRFVRLRELSDAKFANGVRNIADIEAGRAEQARSRIAAGRGKEIMDDLRREIAEIDAVLLTKLQASTDASTWSRDGVERTVSILIFSVAATLLLVTILLSRSIAERRKALERAQELTRRQRAMFDGAVDGMLWLDESGKIVRMNPSVSRMFGYEERELLGEHNLKLIADDIPLKGSLEWLAGVGVAGKDGAGRRQEFVGRRADGSTFDSEVAISRVESDGEDDRRYIVSIRDITLRKRSENLKTEFVSTVSHELRTPLTSIAGSLGLVLGGAAGPLDDRMRRLIGIAHSNCERLVRLINDILDIEKIESGKMDFDLRRMQIAPLIRRVEDSMAGFAEQHDVALEVILPQWPQCIVGDPDRLEQALTNLVSNAIKHSPKAGVVEIMAVQQGPDVRVEVRDRGAGVPIGFRERIFGKFAMADASDSRAKGGTGLGLSIAREIARRHGGDIGFADRDGGGTTFHLAVPMAREQVAASQINTAKEGLPEILHLDDDLDCLSVVAEAFAGKASIVSCESIAAARGELAHGRIRAAILDIGIGEESAMSLGEEIKAMNRNIPVILFTAYDGEAGSDLADRVMIKSKHDIPALVEATMGVIERRGRRAA